MFDVQTTNGEQARATALQGAILSIEALQAYAPGAPLRLRVQLPEGEATWQGKTVGSKRLSDGRYLVRLRLISLRRAERQWLEAQFAAVAVDPSTEGG